MRPSFALGMGVLGGALALSWSCSVLVGVGDYETGDSGAGVPDSSSDTARPTEDAPSHDTGSPEGSACDTPLCNGACCGPTETCLTTNGTEACALQCASGFVLHGSCSSATPCCLAQLEPDGGWNGQGACSALPTTSAGGSCLCTTGADCTDAGACTPVFGFYTCQPNDGALGHGCNENCGTCNDCVVDCHLNKWCAASSAAACSASCPGPNWCVVSSPTCDNEILSCSDDCMLCACM